MFDRVQHITMVRTNRRGPWLTEEDQTLLQLVNSQGPNNWVRVSQHMQFRSPKQCRERYHQNLKPNLKHDPISPQEGEIIEQLVHEMGKRWAEIARRLGDRSDNAVKNWWNGSMNRRKQKVLQHKHVGQRNHPIPLPKTSKDSTSQSERQQYQPGQGHNFAPPWTELPPPEHLSRPLPPPSDPRPSMPAYPAYPPVPFNPGTSHFLPSFSQFTHPRGPLAHSTSPLYSSPMQPLSRSPLQFPFDRPPPTPATFPPHHILEPPLISPAFTELSQAQSPERAPSLISDTQSTYSISPKTVPSPRPDLPAPIDTRMEAWASHLSQRQASSSRELNLHTDEGYSSVLPQSAVSDSKLSVSVPRPPAHRRHSADVPPSRHQGVTNEPSVYTAVVGERAVPPGVCASPKDARMSLSNLLG